MTEKNNSKETITNEKKEGNEMNEQNKGTESQENQKQEGKAPEVKNETPNANAKAAEKTETEKSLVIIEGLIKKNVALKLVGSESKTGTSFFSGKKRLCKVLNTKRGVTIELNVKLPDALSKLPEVENISIATAIKKHLGTMKHYYRATDAKMVGEIMKAAIEAFAAEIKAEKDQAEKEAKEMAAKNNKKQEQKAANA